ncbi:hypothetical protein BC938DRAFT_482989, partial [Jimgerdemannia flammicorona]
MSFHRKNTNNNSNNRNNPRRQNNDAYEDALSRRRDKKRKRRVDNTDQLARVAATAGNQQGPITSSSSTVVTSGPVPMEIPGFYYDPDKKRYFKILPNARLGSDHPHSADSVKAKLMEQNMSPLGDTDKTLRCVGAIDSPLAEQQITDMQVRARVRRADQFIQRLGKLRVGKTAVGDFGIYNENTLCARSEMLDAARMLATQTMDHGDALLGNPNFPAALIVLRVDLHNDPSPGDMRRIDWFTGQASEHVQFDFSRSNATFWACDVARVSGGRIIIGSTEEVIHISDLARVEHYQTQSDVFAVRIDREQPSTFYAGCRDGLLRLFDVRAPRYENKPHRGVGPGGMRHASTVTNVESLSGVGVLACAMDGSVSILCVWDVRAPTVGRETWASHGGGSGVVGGKETRPIVELTGHKNEYTRGLGFAVSETGDV